MKININPSEFEILVVDDEDAIRNFLEEAITEWGFNVRTANDGEVALKMIQENELPHVILTDINMPGLSGISLAKRAKEISEEIEVVIMTANASLDTAVESIKIGVHDYLTKPFNNLNDVKTVLTHVCERIFLKLYNEFLVAELKTKNDEISSQAEMADELADVFDVSRTIEIGCNYIAKANNESPTIFFQYIPKENSFISTARTPEKLLSSAQPKFLIPDQYLGSIEKVTEFMQRLSKENLIADFLNQIESMDLEKSFSPDAQWIFFPFVTRGIPRGFFASKVSNWNEENDRDRAMRYVNALEKYFENALLHHRVVDISIKDGLTGLFNVRIFRDRMEREIKLASRLEHPISLIFFDVDHFKKYNDTHGHPAGDVVLKTIANLMNRKFRSTDMLVRYGGEEFCILMPHTSLSNALKKAEQFRDTIEKHEFPNEHTQPNKSVTVSIGVAEYPTHAANAADLVQSADDALYEAKKKSRNLVAEAIKKEGYVPLFKSKHIPSKCNH
jgi:diguanylate cyclase (GGDEF)-like protein